MEPEIAYQRVIDPEPWTEYIIWFRLDNVMCFERFFKDCRGSGTNSVMIGGTKLIAGEEKTNYEDGCLTIAEDVLTGVKIKMSCSPEFMQNIFTYLSFDYEDEEDEYKETFSYPVYNNNGQIEYRITKKQRDYQIKEWKLFIRHDLYDYIESVDPFIVSIGDDPGYYRRMVVRFEIDSSFRNRIRDLTLNFKGLYKLEQNLQEFLGLLDEIKTEFNNNRSTENKLDGFTIL